MTSNSKDDFEKPFQDRYLACTAALVELEYRLMIVGMSGNKEFQRLCRDFISHGAATFRDMNEPRADMNEPRARVV